MTRFKILFLLAVIAALVGALGAHMTEAWRIGFIAAGALALGFGAAVLMYRRPIYSRMNELESDHKELNQRAQILLRQAERFERQATIERRMATR
jgi:hypothetical protein